MINAYPLVFVSMALRIRRQDNTNSENNHFLSHLWTPCMINDFARFSLMPPIPVHFCPTHFVFPYSAYSVSVPFEGDHANVASNPAWEKHKSKLDNDVKVIFSDSIKKIHRTNGKVSWTVCFYAMLYCMSSTMLWLVLTCVNQIEEKCRWSTFVRGFSTTCTAFSMCLYVLLKSTSNFWNRESVWNIPYLNPLCFCRKRQGFSC